MEITQLTFRLFLMSLFKQALRRSIHGAFIKEEGKRKYIQTLFVRINIACITDNDKKYLAKYIVKLSNMFSIHLINFDGCKVCDVFIKELVNQMQQRKANITSLCISDNIIGNEGALALADMLYTNTTLQYLDLSKNNIRDEGMFALASAILINKTLTNFILGDVITSFTNDNGNISFTHHNLLSYDILEAFSLVLEFNKTLVEFTIPTNCNIFRSLALNMVIKNKKLANSICLASCAD